MTTTYTFEKIRITGIDTTKSYTDANFPIQGTKRILCNGVDRIHKWFTVNDYFNSDLSWNKVFIDKLATFLTDNGVPFDRLDTTEIQIHFPVPSYIAIPIEENDTVAGGWVHYSDYEKSGISELHISCPVTGTDYEIHIQSDLDATETVIADMLYELGVGFVTVKTNGKIY